MQSWSIIFIWLNPAILVIGLVTILVMAYPTSSSLPPADEGNGGGGIDGDDPDGGDPFDWDQPLDLPPGVYVMPSEPIGVPA